MIKKLLHANTQVGRVSVGDISSFAYKEIALDRVPKRYHEGNVLNRFISRHDTVVVCGDEMGKSFKFVGTECSELPYAVKELFKCTDVLARQLYKGSYRSEKGLVEIIIEDGSVRNLSNMVSLKVKIGSNHKFSILVSEDDFYGECVDLKKKLSYVYDEWVDKSGACAETFGVFANELLSLPKFIISLIDSYGRVGIGRVSFISCHPFGLDLFRKGCDEYLGINIMSKKLWNNSEIDVIRGEYQLFFFRTASK